MVQCPSCGAIVPPQTMVFSMRPQFSQVCQTCSGSEQRVSAKEGTRKAYTIGAGVVLVAAVILVLRILAALAR